MKTFLIVGADGFYNTVEHHLGSHCDTMGHMAELRILYASNLKNALAQIQHLGPGDAVLFASEVESAVGPTQGAADLEFHLGTVHVPHAKFQIKDGEACSNCLTKALSYLAFTLFPCQHE